MLNDAHLLDVERGFGVDFTRHNANVYCPHCEREGESKSPSCSVNVEGFYHCKSCEARGYVTQFYAAAHGLTHGQAKDQLLLRNSTTRSAQHDKLRGLAEEHARAKKAVTLDRSLVTQGMDALRHTSKWILHLRDERGLTAATASMFELGADETRLMIPVYNDNGDVINVRRYNRESEQKMIHHTSGDTSPSMWPLQKWMDVEPGKPIIICEGEFDCMLLWQHGYQAFTNINNPSVWFPAWTAKFVSDYPRHEYIIVFDVHDKKMDFGQRMALKLACELIAAGLYVRIATLDLPKQYVGGDVTDYFVKAGRTVADFNKVLASAKEINPAVITPEMIYPPELTAEKQAEEVRRKEASNVPHIPLSEASNSIYYRRHLCIKAMVAGKRTSPYIVPSKVVVTVITDDGEDIRDLAISKSNPYLMQLLDCSARTQLDLIKIMLGLSPKTKCHVTVAETMSVEELYLIPAVGGPGDDLEEGVYVLRTAYYVGHGLATNHVYDFYGITIPDPRTQAATHLIQNAVPVATALDSFKLCAEDIEDLRVFQTDNVAAKMSEIAADFSQHVTHIHGREDLHVAIDLVFHSALHFNFDGRLLRKGWLEALVMGDTRTGKGYVTEGLARHYRMGEVVSGENLTMAGLVGAVQKTGDRWSLVWGKIPLNDKRLVVIDEATGLSTQDIAKMSRIRSEGIAEVTKVISEKTSARARLIWLANPRATNADGRSKMMRDYDYGIQAIPELVGAAEDIARYDFVLIVAQNEVPSDIINTRQKATVPHVFTAERCRKLLAWGWSRKPEHIIFTDVAMQFIYKAAASLGSSFAPSLNLIQAEDVRFKIARIATAAAIRTFSSPDGVQVCVDKCHVEFAFNFLHYIYAKPCCGYLDLSNSIKERESLGDAKQIVEAMRIVVRQSAGRCDLLSLIDNLLDNQRFTATDFADFTGVDVFDIRNLVSTLVRHRAIERAYSYYVKRAAFTKLLRTMKGKLAPDLEGAHA